MPPTPADFSDCVILTGPTGVGKSELSLSLAELLNAEILAADSMTLYRGMDIGTAKPTREEQTRVRHHLIDLLEPWESATVAAWLQQAQQACVEIRGRGKRPLFVGGTPFYLKALTSGLFDAPQVDPAIRSRLEVEAATVGNLDFHAKLAKVDPKSAARLHPNDVRRVVRALEVYEATGQTLSSLQKTWSGATFDAPETPGPPTIILERPREQLYSRIDQRVNQMIASGWFEEVVALTQLPQPLSREAAQALGYRELFALVRGGANREETITEIQLRTRQFAKRQLTWFRSMTHAITMNAQVSATEVAARLHRYQDEVAESNG